MGGGVLGHGHEIQNVPMHETFRVSVCTGEVV